VLPARAQGVKSSKRKGRVCVFLSVESGLQPGDAKAVMKFPTDIKMHFCQPSGRAMVKTGPASGLQIPVRRSLTY
jgi:hypothetical protein